MDVEELATEGDTLLAIFKELLQGPTGDGRKKRRAGEKPPWYADGSHWPALKRHLDAYVNDEGLDKDSRVHALIHCAWRCLAIAAIETGKTPTGKSYEDLTKRCITCGETKKLPEFVKADMAHYFGRGAYCKHCYKLRDHGQRNRTREELLQLQGGRCAICFRKEDPNGRNMAVDHDHKTGMIRGVLCSQCNGAIGMLNENPEVMARAIAYVSRRETYGQVDPRNRNK